MRFSLSWLKNYVNVEYTAQELAPKLTSVGLELEGIEDQVLEIAVPSNRADCLGIMGIAREVATISNTQGKQSTFPKIKATIPDEVPIEIKQPNKCPAYYGRVIKNVNPQAKTPKWMQEVLTTSGINCISATVDITNYVMLETGQPSHAFDLKHIDQKIIVDTAKNNESLKLLDGSQIKLNDETLLIKDNSKALALAGIMGGEESGVADDTTDLFIECAYFEPVNIRLTARNYGVTSDSQYRFERCVDHQAQSRVIERLTELVLQVCGGEPGPVSSAIYEANLPASVSILLRKDRINKILGILPADDVIESLLHNLGFELDKDAKGWTVKVPSYRPDVSIEVDLIEEIARIYGFDNIPAQTSIGSLQFKVHPEAITFEDQIKRCIAARGYNEAITYSFIPPEIGVLFGCNEDEQLQLANPISADLKTMRHSLLPSLCLAVQYNQNRQRRRVRLFEVGLTFLKNNPDIVQEKYIAAVATGSLFLETAGNNKQDVDFFAVKGDILALCKLSQHNDVVFEPIKANEYTSYHPGQAAKIVTGEGKTLGVVGRLHPRLMKDLDLQEPVFAFELDFKVLQSGSISQFKEFGKFPSTQRDLAILIKDNITAVEIINAARTVNSELLSDIQLFDVYKGKGIEPGFKSVAIRLMLAHPERTLIEDEVEKLCAKVISSLQELLGATLRS